MRIKCFLVTMIVVLSTVLSSCSLLFPAEERTTPPPIIEPEVINYVTKEVGYDTISNTVQKSGSFTSVDQYNLSFEKRGGFIKEINMSFRKEVKKGEVLAAFETTEIEKQVAEQKLAVESARIDYNNAVRQVQAARENYERVVAAAALDRSIADKIIEGKRKDYADGIISEFELSQAESAYKHTVADIQSKVTQAYNAAVNQADEKALVSLNQAEMKLRNLREEFEKSVIRSPIDGVISFYEDLKIGSYVEARKVIATVVDDKNLLLLVANTLNSVSFVADFPLDAEVDVRILSEVFKGKIVFSPVDAPLNSYLSEFPYILVEVDVPSEKVTLGTSATITIVTSSRENVLVVPSNAVTQYGSYVYVMVFEDGVCKERPVEVGLVTPTKVEIVDGLKAGELIVIR